jgi:hypothetical protein
MNLHEVSGGGNLDPYTNGVIFTFKLFTAIIAAQTRPTTISSTPGDIVYGYLLADTPDNDYIVTFWNATRNIYVFQ